MKVAQNGFPLEGQTLAKHRELHWLSFTLKKTDISGITHRLSGPLTQ